MTSLLRSLLALAIFAGALSMPTPARAACGAIPYIFNNNSGVNSIVDATTTNANNSSLLSCATNVDATQIGSAGIYATQIKPTSSAQAIFGGTVVYAFPSGLTVNGALLQANAGLTVVGTTNLAATTFSVPPTMSGASITAGTIPNASLVTTPITTITAGTNITTSGSAPNITINAASLSAFTSGGVSRPGVKFVADAATFSAASSVSITFPAAFWTSGSTYACYGAGFNTNNGFYFNQGSATTTTMNSVGGTSITGSEPYACIGY